MPVNRRRTGLLALLIAAFSLMLMSCSPQHPVPEADALLLPENGKVFPIGGVSLKGYSLKVGTRYYSMGYNNQNKTYITVTDQGNRGDRKWAHVNVEYSNGDAFGFKIYQQNPQANLGTRVGMRAAMILSDIDQMSDGKTAVMGINFMSTQVLSLDNKSPERTSNFSERGHGVSEWNIDMDRNFSDGPIIIESRPSSQTKGESIQVSPGMSSITGLTGTFETYPGDSVSMNQVGIFTVTDFVIKNIDTGQFLDQSQGTVSISLRWG